MKLPRELLDEIFSLIYGEYGGKETLRACSLVERSWVYPAQRLLFYHIVINVATYPSWEGRTRPRKAALLYHIRSLYYRAQGRNTFLEWRNRTSSPREAELFDHTRSLHYYGYHSDGRDINPRQLPPFRQLQTPTLSGSNIRYFQHVNPFSAFQNTLSSLRLSCVRFSWPSCFAVVGYFPNLSNLEISSPLRGDNNREPIIPSRPLRGRLIINEFPLAHLSIFLDQLSNMQVAYDELEISREPVFWSFDSRLYQRLINTCEKSLLTLTLHRYYTALDLQNCLELHTLVFYQPESCERLCATIASITSKSFHKILYEVVFPLDAPSRLALEDAMCGLVERLCMLGYEDALELEFQFSPDAFNSVRCSRARRVELSVCFSFALVNCIVPYS
ncbi:hypothetical protein BJ322DRAFT_1104579 [Thelephora terrestris]|uniref:Uncharacterized protein n=1 Tax=Thelephora terrestris TaxID=56493 RepID=A0A9P6HN83_9AGAM|nr:hypothetical protein BJ322DRAFT_1104579 [Thelephora terrestris]